MISTRLSALAASLRRAAGCNAYEEAQRLVVELGAAAADETRSLPAGHPHILEVAAWLDELLEWTGIMLRTSRAAQAEELRCIPFVKTYLRPPDRQPTQVRMDL